MQPQRLYPCTRIMIAALFCTALATAETALAADYTRMVHARHQRTLSAAVPEVSAKDHASQERRELHLAEQECIRRRPIAPLDGVVTRSPV